jgi:lysozyme
MNMQPTPRALALTKAFEGLRLTAYQDGHGIWTIGYGHTGDDVREGLAISELEADALLIADMRTAVRCVNEAVTAPVMQGQFDALVDFAYNVGCTAFRHSSLLSCVNQSEFTAAAEKFLQWTRVAGKVCDGLQRRREAERTLFLGA